MSMTQCRLFSIAQWLRTRPEEMFQNHERGDVIVCPLLDFSADLARAFDHDDGLQAGPTVGLL